MVTMTTSPDSCVDTAGGVLAPFAEKDGASAKSYTSQEFWKGGYFADGH
jgi:hypothetical protein